MENIDLKKLARTSYDLLQEEFPGHSRRKLLKLKEQYINKLSLEDRIKLDSEKKGNYKFRELYKTATEENERLRKELDESFKIKKPLQTYAIKPSNKERGEAVAFIIASDWHIEEEVRPGEVNGLNKFTLEIAEDRTTQFFQNALKLYKMSSQNIEINTIVLALLGDFISGSIHDELLETNQLLPGDAIWKAQNIIASGIDFLLKNTTADLVIPCAPGNHSRITKKQRHATEQGNSLETYMYKNLALFYANEKRIKFIISEGYHIYLNIYDYTIRLHHGHALNYGGGVGGLTIPVNKAIAQWNRARRADLDVFGHWHTQFDGGNFICNGSLIGFNAYAVAIKAAFEKPKQSFFLIDKKRGKTITAPIVFD